MLLVTMSAMLVLFAGCGDKDDGGDKESLATLVAETVSSSTTTNKISTQGPSGITFEATIVSQGGDAEWCSFDLNKQVSQLQGEVREVASQPRTERIIVPPIIRTWNYPPPPVIIRPQPPPPRPVPPRPIPLPVKPSLYRS